MRPPRPDIAAPELPPGIAWIGGRGPRMEGLTAAGPVLVHFWDLAQANSVRTLPYLTAWHGRYADLGLATIGVHSPRHPFTADPAIVELAVAELGLPYPVACDSEHAIWHDYGCEGWPSLFLWGRGGALRWFHFGEGEYEGTELAIQELLGEPDGEHELPPPLEPLRATDVPGALVAAPSPEIFPGGSEAQPWTADENADALEVDYEAGGVYAAVEGDGELLVSIDGGPRRPARRLTPGLHELAAHDRHERHALTLRPAVGQRVYSISFAAGMPGPG